MDLLIKKNKKLFEIGILVFFTIVLMIFFYGKKKYFSTFSDKGIQLLAKYAEGLSPINQQLKYNNEDIVNFALYGNLPLDKKINKYLILNYDPSGKVKYIITDAAPKAVSNNYENLVKNFGQDEAKLKFLDTVIQSSKENLYQAILFSDKETYAISPKVLQIQSELKSQIEKLVSINDLALSKQTNEFIKQTENLNKELASNKNFIFINPDTALNVIGKIKKVRSTNGKKEKIIVAADKLDLKSLNPSQFTKRVIFDKGNGFVRVNIPSVKIPKNVNFNMHSNADGLIFNSNENGNSFSFNIEKLPEEVKVDLKKLNTELVNQIGTIQFQIDSAGVFFKIPNVDSLKNKISSKRR